MRRVVLLTTAVGLWIPAMALAQGGATPIVIDAQVPSNPAPPASPSPARREIPRGAQPTAPVVIISADVPPAQVAPPAAAPVAPASAVPTATSVPGPAVAAPVPPGAPVESSPLVITGAPQPQPQYGPPPGYVPYAQPRPGVMYPPPYGYPGYPPPEAYGPPPQPAPQPDTPERIAATWRRRFAIGATFGVGSPLGVLGAFFEYNPERLWGLTAGVGVGGWFGPAIAFGGYVRPITWGRWAPYIGVGWSFNFTPGEFTHDPNLEVGSLSHWLNTEVGMEYRSFRGVLFRFGLGNALMLNTGDFTNVDFAGHYGPFSNHSLGYDPVSAADAHDDGHVLNFAYIHVDIGFGFD